LFLTGSLRLLPPPPHCCLVLGVQAEGGEWKEELMFRVPRDHQEILRLEGRYKR
jgi:hypothetical protein